MRDARKFNPALWCAIGISVCGAPAPADAQSEAVQSFIASANALVSSSQASIADGRNIARLDSIRGAVSELMLAEETLKSKKFVIDLKSEDILCLPRARTVSAAVSYNYIKSFSTKLAEIAKPAKIDNLSTAIGTLFSSQTLDISTGIGSSADLDKIVGAMLSRCSKDLGSFDEAYYGLNIRGGPESGPALGLFAAIGGLIETIRNIIQPFVIEGAQIVDQARREAAIRQFLQNPANVKLITSSGENLARYVSAFVWNQRLRLAGQFEEEMAGLRSTEVALDKLPGCKTYLAEGRATSEDKSKLTDSFILCWKDAWKAVSGASASVLKAATAYDQLADTGDSDNALNAFKALSSRLSQIGQGQVDVGFVWDQVVRIIAFGAKVEAAFSVENRKKLDTAVDNLMSAI